MTRRVTLVQGGGIGYDQADAVTRILDAAGAQIEWEVHLAGLAAIEQGQPPLSEELLASVRRNRLALKTKLLVPAAEPGRNYNVRFRRALDLFVSVRPLRNIPGLPSRFKDVNLVVIREQTEDLYTAIEHEVVPGVVQSIKVVTEKACRRFFRFAFQYATDHGRKLIHCVHKANILKQADGLFLECFRETAREFPAIETREIIVDACCMQLVRRPQQFDVLAMGNLYGDIVSDLGAGLVGGISATLGVNYGDGLEVYEAFHGGTSEEIGHGQANPLPLLFPAIEMLKAIDQEQPAERIEAAVARVLTDGQTLTPDLGGSASTAQMAEAIIAALPLEL